MKLLIELDGFAFLLMGLIVLATPSPQPGLTKKVDEQDLLPFSQPRRLLAAMFVASALLLIIVGRNVTDVAVLRQVGYARIASFVLVIALNVIQLVKKRWKAAPLIVLIATFSSLAIAYSCFVF